MLNKKKTLHTLQFILPRLQLALISEDVGAVVLAELRLLLPVRVRRDGGVGGGWKD